MAKVQNKSGKIRSMGNDGDYVFCYIMENGKGYSEWLT